jgi:hypothetical protein
MLRTFASDREFMDHIAGTPVEVDQWQLEKLGLITANVQLLYCVPRVSREFRKYLWGTAYPTALTAVSAMMSSLPRNASIVSPDGPMSLRVLQAMF